MEAKINSLASVMVIMALNSCFKNSQCIDLKRFALALTYQAFVLSFFFVFFLGVN